MDTTAILAALLLERDRIDQAIAALESLNGTAISPAKSAAKNAKTPAAAKKRVFSPESRQRMAEAQQKRWAKKKRAVKAAAKKTALSPAAKKPAKEAQKKAAPKKSKGGITAAGRKNM
jgi:hypothetical protein